MGDGSRVDTHGRLDAAEPDVSDPVDRLLLDSRGGPDRLTIQQWQEINAAAAEITIGVTKYVEMALAFIWGHPWEDGKPPTVEDLRLARQALHSKYNGFTGMAARMVPEDPV